MALWRTVLADRSVLIVLDDASDANQVRPLLPAAPGCAAIVTTWRHLIDLSGVRWFRLDALPRGDALEMPARLEDDLYRPAGGNDDCALIEAPLLLAQSRSADRGPSRPDKPGHRGPAHRGTGAVPSA